MPQVHRSLVLGAPICEIGEAGYWMLAVMVAFTTGGLFLLSQANQ
jgi:hypothetical protein